MRARSRARLRLGKSCIIDGVSYFQVEILNDVSSLYENVDKDQLTPCLGGTLNYDHQEWVQHRTVSHHLNNYSSKEMLIRENIHQE